MLNILGPSGVGKGTIIKMILTEFKDKIKFSTSNTTRKMREGEIDGVSYHFTPLDKFKEMIEEDKFVEYVCFSNNYYGTSKQELVNKLSDKSLLVLDLDIGGAKKLFELNLGVEYIALFPPKFDALKDRLMKRGTESEETINNRLQIAEKEIKEINTLDYIKYKIINDDLDKCYEEVRETIVKLYPFLKDS